MDKFEIPTIGFSRYIKQRPLNRPNLILPGIRSDNPKFHEFLSDLSDRLEDNFPTSPTRHGLLEEPFSPGGWLKLHNLSGYRMNPMGVPRTGASPKNKGFANRAHSDLFQKIVSSYFGDYIATPARINKMSSTGCPHFSYDPALKLSYAFIFEKRFNKIDELAGKRQWWELHENYGLSMMSAITRRYQSTDSVTVQHGKLASKPRVVQTFEGNETVASKATPFPEMFAQRVRLAVAFSASYGIFLQMVIGGYRAMALTKSIWHHTTPLQIARKIGDFVHVRAGDVKNFDQNMDPAMVHLALEYLSKDWRSSVIEMLKASVGCPFVVNEDRVGGPGRFKWIGDPRDNSTYYDWYGFPSGVPMVSDVGKILGAFIDIVPLIDLGVVALEEVDHVIEGTHPKVRVLNQGDDFLTCFKHEDDAARWDAYMAENHHPYYDVVLESPASFLGNLITSSQGSVIAVPNILSYPLNMFGRERGIDSRFSPYWAFGYQMKRQFYGMHPLFQSVDRHIQQCSLKHFGATLSDLIPMEAAPRGMDMRNFYDTAFLENPDRIHYRFQPNNVSADLLATIFLSIPFGDVARIVRQWRK